MSLIHFCGFCQSTSAKGGKLTLRWESKPVFLLGKQRCRAQAILGGKALKIKRGHARTRTPAHTHQFHYSQTTIQTQEQLHNICEIVQDCIVNVNTVARVNVKRLMSALVQYSSLLGGATSVITATLFLPT